MYQYDRDVLNVFWSLKADNLAYDSSPLLTGIADGFDCNIEPLVQSKLLLLPCLEKSNPIPLYYYQNPVVVFCYIACAHVAWECSASIDHIIDYGQFDAIDNERVD